MVAARRRKLGEKEVTCHSVFVVACEDLILREAVLFGGRTNNNVDGLHW
jgi:hypothetical protein